MTSPKPLSRAKYPGDASLVLVVAPQGKVEAFEVELLRRYMTELNSLLK